ncbi:MAG: peptide chain release factor 3, partial [Acidimicrobiia bacterium]|nr:peptide chain release factor 3 [Acidimicrobiia bacterium]
MTAPRRTFAIISHPDAGKTTLTEKLLMYSGAISEAGAVKARAGKQRDVTSDWMEMERERGISITSTVLQFNYDGHVFNLLDTPGHRDFSEDTYRVLSAVDAAIIVLDAAKGIEAQTKKLFEVAKRKKTPIITLINKCDRPGLAPLELLDDIEDQLGIVATPLTWPVGMGPDFVGVVDRRDNAFWKFGRTDHGATAAAEERLEGADLASHGDVGITAAGELDLLDGVGADHDLELFLAGETTPVFFGSAVWNFGIRLLLDAIADLAPAPSPRLTISEDRQPIDGEFSGFVFKIQANLDPRHRDRIAYLRVNSGQFERGIQLTNHRTQRSFAANFAHQLFGRDRETVAMAHPGDIIGLISSGNLQIGDTLSESG